MIIDRLATDKYNDAIKVTSDLYVDNKELFCGNPGILLFAFKRSRGRWTSFKDYEIGIEVLDNDDFRAGFIYKANKDNFEDILHELINFMIDHEKGITKTSDILHHIDEFFPDLGCVREYW